MTTRKFAKRHYEAIGTAMQEAAPLPGWSANKHARWTVTVSRSADAFAADSGNFKRDRFTRACEPGANVRDRS
jgi:hypothetical protein